MTNDQTTDPLARIRAAMEGLRAAMDEPAGVVIYALAEHEHGQATALLAWGKSMLGAIEAEGMDYSTDEMGDYVSIPNALAHRLADDYTRQAREAVR